MSRHRSKPVQGQDGTTQILTENTETDRLGCRASDCFNVSFSLFMTLKSNKILYACIFMHVCVHVGEHCMTE